MSKKRAAQPTAKPAITVIGKPRPRRYRLLARLPTSARLSVPGSFRLSSGAYPEFAIRPIHETVDDQMDIGGSFAAVEFAEHSETDFVKVAARAVNILEEALAAIALVSGVALTEVTPIQLLETTAGKAPWRFMVFLPTAVNSWSTQISPQHLQDARTVLAHWEPGGYGHRLRRAAYLYANAIGAKDPRDVFERAWLGLEALEPPLAREANRKPGQESVTASCPKCGADYVYTRGTLGGVRAFVSGELHRDSVDLGDWRRINGLRNELMHSLEDLGSLRVRAEEEAPAALHYLHDASAHLAHVHHLEVNPYEAKLLHNPYTPLLMGETLEEARVPLAAWSPMIDVLRVRWTEVGGAMVPDFGMTGRDGEPPPAGRFFSLTRALSQASEADLEAELPSDGWRVWNDSADGMDDDS